MGMTEREFAVNWREPTPIYGTPSVHQSSGIDWTDPKVIEAMEELERSAARYSREADRSFHQTQEILSLEKKR